MSEADRKESTAQKLIRQKLGAVSPNRFLPTVQQKQAKSAFWSHFFSTGEVAPSPIDPALAAVQSGHNEILQWWYEVPGFPEWFSNGEEFRQRVEYVSNLALDVLEAVLQDRDARQSDRLQAAKMALEVAAKFPKTQGKEQFADEKIGQMDKKQLEEFIFNRMKVVRLPTP